MPCKGGFRASIEASKKQREADKIYRESPEHKHWESLVRRVNGAPNGIDELSIHEKTYFAVSMLIFEVDNGGFHQFFFNSTGSLYAYALNGLLELEAHQTVGLLTRAKEALFGQSPVSKDVGTRRRQLPEDEPVGLLDALDKEFYKDQESIAERCRAYAVAHSLFSDG